MKILRGLKLKKIIDVPISHITVYQGLLIVPYKIPNSEIRQNGTNIIKLLKLKQKKNIQEHKL